MITITTATAAATTATTAVVVLIAVAVMIFIVGLKDGKERTGEATFMGIEGRARCDGNNRPEKSGVGQGGLGRLGQG